MTTKAEWFRYFVERAGPKRTSRRRAEPGRGAPVRGAGTPSRHAAQKAGYALEAGGGRPSRKSTRGSANRQKNDVQFRLKRRMAEGKGRSRGAR